MSIIFGGKTRIILTAAAGAVLVCAFAPFSYWWLTLICPIVLYASLFNQTSKAAFLAGFVFGLFFFGFGVPWTFNSIHEFGHAPIVLSAFLAALLVLILALFPALTCYVFVRLQCNKNLNVISALAFSIARKDFGWARRRSYHVR